MEKLSFLTVVLIYFSQAVAGADTYSRYDFPSDFVFGAGTTAYQVEGAAFEDGRTPSIWDTATHSGVGPSGNGDIACDEYHKYKEDVHLMEKIGLEAYRFSISWSRLIPNGRGPINQKALQYYNNLIDELSSRGIQPHATLFHFDLPQALEDEYGGWISRKIVKDFTAYADVCFREFGDRVSHWMTISEPNMFARGGYDLGFSAPQRCSPPFGVANCSRGNSITEPYIAAHHMLIAHASATRLYKKEYQGKQGGLIGISLYFFWCIPSTDSKKDAIATRRANDFLHGWFMDPLVFGDYPSTMKEFAGEKLPTLTSREKNLVKGAFDFIGVIHYMNAYIKDNPSRLSIGSRDYNLDMGVELIGGVDPTNSSLVIELPIEPWGMRELLESIKQVYENPTLYIYENGQSMSHNSTVEDTPRVMYLSAYIGAVLDALRNGSNTKGYFVWSFLDLYELLNGYKSSFGLVYVDMDDPDRRRIPKLSATWYSQFLKGKTVIAAVSDSEFASSQLAAS